MRIPLPTTISTRDGSLTKDAKMLNAFVDGEAVVKRPATSLGATASGTAQGGISNNSLVYVINGDSLRSYNSSYTLVATIAL